MYGYNYRKYVNAIHNHSLSDTWRKQALLSTEFPVDCITQVFIDGLLLVRNVDYWIHGSRLLVNSTYEGTFMMVIMYYIEERMNNVVVKS